MTNQKMMAVAALDLMSLVALIAICRLAEWPAYISIPFLVVGRLAFAWPIGLLCGKTLAQLLSAPTFND
jgi:hypothetical protein